MMQQRRDELQAKREKLAELKRQRALREGGASSDRGSIGSNYDVNSPWRRTRRVYITDTSSADIGKTFTNSR